MRILRKHREAIIIAVAAVVLRGGYICFTPVPRLVADSLSYHSYAVSILSEGRFQDQDARAARMPGYPAFVSLIYAIFGTSTRAVQAIQCALGVMTCLFLYACAAQIAAPPWPFLTGMTAALYCDLAEPSSWLMTECLYSFLLAAALAVLYRRSWTTSRRAWLGGSALGLNYLVRPEILPFAIAISGALSFMIQPFRRRDCLKALTPIVVLMCLWVGRNYAIFDRVIPVSTVGSFNVYMGLRLSLRHQRLALEQPYQPPEGLTELQRDESYRNAYRELVRRVPFINRLKAYAFNLLSVYYPFLPGYDFTYVFLIPFWLAGFWQACRRKELWPMAGLVIGLSGVYAVFAGPVSRYRFGFSPCLILLGCVGAKALYDNIRQSMFVRVATLWLAANMACWVWAPDLRLAALWLKAIIWK